MNKILRSIIIGLVVVICLNFLQYGIIAQTQITKTNHNKKGIDNFIQKLGYKFVDSYKLKIGEFKSATTTIYKDVDDLTRIEKIIDSKNKVLRVTLMLPNACMISKYDSLMDEKMGKEIWDVIKTQGAMRLVMFLDYVMEGQEDTKIADFITNTVEQASGTIQKKQFGDYDVSVLASSISPLVTVSVEER